MRTTSRTGRTALLTAAGLTTLALVTACGSSGDGGAAAPATSAPATSAAPSAPPTGAPAGGSPLQVATDPKLGPIVTDAAGLTLYRFDKDTAKPPVSNCNGNCAVTWPPVPAGDPAAVKGLDAKLVGSVTRADGAKQLTLNGWPLYRYAPDTKPGETKGQGVGGNWFVVAPTGEKAAAPTGSGTPGYGGY
ncbi:hypothetical protein ACWEQL_13460 [Kitasatospora sp. NPDC004240]